MCYDNKLAKRHASRWRLHIRDSKPIASKRGQGICAYACTYRPRYVHTYVCFYRPSCIRSAAAHLHIQHKTKREPPKSPTTNIKTTSSRLLAPTAYRVAILIDAKNGAMTTTIAAMTIGWKTRGPRNFINADQITPYAIDQTF